MTIIDKAKKITKTIILEVLLKVHGIRYKNGVVWGYRKYLPKKIEPKAALLSYFARPFITFSDKYPHNNYGLSRNIAKALNQLGYTVDIIDWDLDFVPAKKYDLFIGVGKNLANIASALDKDCLKIFFATTIYWKFWNEQEIKRLEMAREKKGRKFQPDRLLEESEEDNSTKTDAVIALGNEFCRKTYAAFPEVYMLNIFFRPDKKFDLAKKNFSEAKNNFLFIGGSGNIHKGLALALEAFAQMPDKNLFICTKLNKDFSEAYHNELFETKNIRFVGFLKEQSEELRNLMYRCGYLVYPSCAEGSPGAAVLAMSYGLLPIISQESNVDVDPIGYLLKEGTAEEVIKAVNIVGGQAYDREKAEQICRYTAENFSEKFFFETFKKYLNIILAKRSDFKKTSIGGK